MSANLDLTVPYRAVAILKSKPGSENALLQFTLSVAPRIRAVSGLAKLEINQAIDDPGRLVLNYWWVSPTHSEAYVAGALYAEIMPTLETLVLDHAVIFARNIESKIGQQ